MLFYKDELQIGIRLKMRLSCDHELANLFKNARHIAVLGVSEKTDRPSNQVFYFLKNEGFEVTPINPRLKGRRLFGHKVVGSLEEVQRPICIVDVFRESKWLPEIVETVISLQIPSIWTQLGVSNATAETRALEAGINLVINRCPAVEIPRLKKTAFLQLGNC